MDGLDEVDGKKLFYVTLPWPPSINKYWRRNGNRYFISKEGQEFRKEVQFLCLQGRGVFEKHEKLSVQIHAYPPDRRRRDLDNICKSLLDALEHADVYVDDNQIDELFVKRQPDLKGQVIVNISVIQNGTSL